MRRLIVNADDFGLSRGVNRGILRAHREGIVTSATIMVNMPAAAEAFEIARETPGLGVGLHLTLTGGYPLAEGVHTLVGPDGRFLRLTALREGAKTEHLAQEIRAQVEVFLASGLMPTHVDSHHHVHGELPVVAELLSAEADRLGIPMRQFGPNFDTSFYGREASTPQHLIQIMTGMNEGVLELMCHPGEVDADLIARSSYVPERELELAALTDSEVLAAVSQLGIALSNYRDVKNPLR